MNLRRFYLGLLIIVGTLIPLGAQAANEYRDAVLSTPTLRGYYRFEEAGGASTAVDSSGNGYNATAASVTFQQTGLLINDSSKSGLFDGSASKVTTPSGAFDFERTQAFTIEMLVKPNITRSGSFAEYSLFSNINNSSPFNGYELELAWNGTDKTIARVFMISDYGATNYLLATGNIDITNGVTHRIALSYSGNSNVSGLSLYIDGKKEDLTATTNSLSGSILAPATPTIGSRGSIRFFPGNIDEVAVYTSALSETTIINHLKLALASPRDAVIPSHPTIIFDTDIAPDVDDVGDMGVLHALANNGEISIGGIITSSGNDYSPSAVKAINNYYGRRNIPIGAYKGTYVSSSGNTSSYTQKLRDDFIGTSETRSSYPDATIVYRQVLASSTNASVVIVSTGFFQALKALLQSSADSISPLTGSQLVAQKVKTMVVVAGIYPSGDEPNFQIDPDGGNYVFANWPGDIVSVGIELGNTIYSRPPTTDSTSVNPLRDAYFEAIGNSLRPAWGQLGVLYGARGLSTNFFTFAADGTTAVNSSTGSNLWTQTPDANHAYLGAITGDTAFGTIFNTFLDQDPDTVAPVISSISATNNSNSSTTITWTTNKYSDSQVIYGLTSSYTATTSYDYRTVVSHSVVLNGLSSCTTYHYRVLSSATAFAQATSSDQTFISGGCESVAPTVSMTAPSNGATVSGSSVSLTANASDNSGVGGVQFKLDTNTNIGSEDTVSPYAVTWNSTGASDGSHTLIAVARDIYGNYATSTAVTVTVDNLTPPVISSVSASNVTQTGATITWSTNESSNSILIYGTTTGTYTATSTDASLVTSHSASLSGLSLATTYYYRVISVDAQNNRATSTQSSFTTSSATAPAASSNGGSSSGSSVSAATAASLGLYNLRPVTAGVAPVAPTSITPQSIGISAKGFTRSLVMGSENTEVTSLQKLLSLIPGIYPEKKVTGYYGALTKQAIQRFQILYKIVSSEKDPGYGIVGPKTRAALNKLLKP